MRAFSLALLLSFVSLACAGAPKAEEKSKILAEQKMSAEEFLNADSCNGDALLKKALEHYALNKHDIAEEYMSLATIFAAKEKQAGTEAPKELMQFFITDPALSAEFAQNISPKDDTKMLFKILSEIWEDSRENFEKYPRLAIAISIVFDTPPPEIWPHHQVSSEILPRKLGNPLEVFQTRTDAKNRGRFLMQPDKLSIEEAKYLVASMASPKDWEWVRKSVSVNLANLPKLYPSIAYDSMRIDSKRFHWSAADYNLETIKKIGGICVDQAYYTAEVAKIRGVPAMIFTGAGADGFHAWVGYMQKSGAWSFDVGRYESSRFVTGTAVDPQTWDKASDHSLNSMSERFRDSPKYKANLYHTLFAKKFLEMEDLQKAEAAAKAAAISDPRNADTWEILLAVNEKLGRDKKEIIKLYEAAIKAFARYPDTESEYRKRLMNFYGKDDIEAARKVSSAMISKSRRERPDLAMEFARADIENDISDDNTEKLYSSYKRLINVFKSDGGNAIMGILLPVSKHLMMKGKFAETREIVKITEQAIKVKGNTTIESTLLNVRKWIDDNEALYRARKT